MRAKRAKYVQDVVVLIRQVITLGECCRSAEWKCKSSTLTELGESSLKALDRLSVGFRELLRTTENPAVTSAELADVVALWSLDEAAENVFSRFDAFLTSILKEDGIGVEVKSFVRLLDSFLVAPVVGPNPQLRLDSVLDGLLNLKATSKTRFETCRCFLVSRVLGQLSDVARNRQALEQAVSEFQCAQVAIRAVQSSARETEVRPSSVDVGPGAEWPRFSDDEIAEIARRMSLKGSSRFSRERSGSRDVDRRWLGTVVFLAERLKSVEAENCILRRVKEQSVDHVQ